MSFEAEPSAVASHDGGWLTLEAPVMPVEALMAHAQSSWMWAPRQDVPEGSSPEAEGLEYCAGFGVARRFAARGPQRMATLRRQVDAYLGQLEPSGHEDHSLLPRVFGGGAFQSSSDHPEPWGEFDDAQFVLPKVLYARRGDWARFGVWVPEKRLGALNAVRAEVAALQQELSALAELSMAEPMTQSELRPTQVESCDAEEWKQLVSAALVEISAGRFDKVVLARRATLHFAQPLSLSRTLAALTVNYPTAARFAFRGGDRAFVGATPERLVRKFGLRVASEALAGTFRKNSDTFAEELLRSPKEHAEHQPVLAAVVAALRDYCQRLEHPPGPQLRELRHLFHLQTPIVGELRGPRHVLELVEALHPTPAVGGVPTRAALDWITEHEHLERGWYAGPIGWFDAAGDGEFSVALRTGLIRGRTAQLYAGAGIVRGSVPDSEYQETELKLRALSGALRADIKP